MIVRNERAFYTVRCLPPTIAWIVVVWLIVSACEAAERAGQMFRYVETHSIKRSDSFARNVISPDNRFVYVSLGSDMALLIFRRDPETGLTRLHRLFQYPEAENPIPGAEPVPDKSKRGAICELRTSPDGRFLYVTTGRGIEIFQRDKETGDLTYLESFEQKFNSFFPVPDHTFYCLACATHLTLSADGRSMYAIRPSDYALTVLARDAASGTFTYQQVFQADDTAQSAIPGKVSGQTLAPIASIVDGLSGVSDVKCSPDSRFVYATATGDNCVSWFARDPSQGILRFVDLLREQPTKNGKHDKEYGLHFVSSLAVSLDGKNVYTTDVNGIGVFSRDLKSGALTPLQYRHDREIGKSASRTHCVTLAPNGKLVLAIANGGTALNAYRRNPNDGTLTLAGRIKNGEEGVRGLRGTDHISISHDGRFVYATSADAALVTAEILYDNDETPDGKK